jgi:hypothetical protein
MQEPGNFSKKQPSRKRKHDGGKVSWSGSIAHETDDVTWVAVGKEREEKLRSPPRLGEQNAKKKRIHRPHDPWIGCMPKWLSARN